MKPGLQIVQTPAPAGVVTPTCSGPVNLVLRCLARWRVRLTLADAELALDRVQDDMRLLPTVEAELRRDIDALRVELATLQPLQRA